AVFNDDDAGQILTLTSNVDSVFPGATFTVSGTNPATATICADELVASLGVHYLTIGVRDDACPIRGQQHYLYTVIVEQGADAGNDASIAVCQSMAPFLLFDSLDTNEPGTWTGPDGEAFDGIFHPAIDPPGDYTYVTTVASGCSDTATVTVVQLPETDPLCIFLGTDQAVVRTASVAPNPSHGTLVLRNTHALRVDLMDMQGRVVWSSAEGTNQDTWTIQVPPSISNGPYLLRVFERDRTSTLHIELQR
ncbi:MAG TPA: T9SS type A sorting domain-containing protein, partial [Flavobacteriales bacterium]|nr:T9SS type A sorting domain-containing protein [Flavobacteriales bacterium]